MKSKRRDLVVTSCYDCPLLERDWKGCTEGVSLRESTEGYDDWETPKSCPLRTTKYVLDLVLVLGPDEDDVEETP